MFQNNKVNSQNHLSLLLCTSLCVFHLIDILAGGGGGEVEL